MPKTPALAIQERPPVNPAEAVDVREKGRSATGEVLSSDRRLFMQFMAFGGSKDSARLSQALNRAGIDGVLYEDINDPYGVGLLTFSESPAILWRRRARF